MNSNIFFITGRIRSGTTLLNRILNNHSDIFIPQESPYIMHLYTKYNNITTWNENKILSFYDDLWKEIRVTQFWKLDRVKDELKKELLALGNKANFVSLCDVVFKVQAKNRGDQQAFIWGDKNPSYALYLNELRKAFPNAKFILLVRDARSNILSCQNASFDFNDVAILAERWNYFIKKINQFHKKNPQHSLIVKYEDLLQQGEQTLKDICKFLGISYQNQLLDFHKKDEKLESWKKFYNRPLEADKVLKWKKEMIKENIQVTEQISRKWLKHHGYELIEPRQTLLKTLRNIHKVLFAKGINFLENIVYLIPMNVRVKIINTYRKKTGTL